MDETDPAPAGEQPEDAEANPSEETLRQGLEQAVPGRPESEPPPGDPGGGGWVPV
jgi:hypothetical protein